MGNCCYVAVCLAAQGTSAPKGEREERGGGHTVAAARPQLVLCSISMVFSSSSLTLLVGRQEGLLGPDSNNPVRYFFGEET